MLVKVLVAAFLFGEIIECSVDMFKSSDFQVLACSEQRNITVLCNDVSLWYFERFLHLLEESIGSDPCYIVNIYLPKEDHLVRMKKKANYMPHIDRNFHFHLIEMLGSKTSETFPQIKRYIKESTEGDVKQTFVYMFKETFSSPLPGLKFQSNLGTWVPDQKNMDVIVYLQSKNSHTYLGVIPPHRIFVTDWNLLIF